MSEEASETKSNQNSNSSNESVSDKPPNKAAREYRKRMREKLIKKEETISKLKEENSKLINRKLQLIKALDEINKIIAYSDSYATPPHVYDPGLRMNADPSASFMQRQALMHRMDPRFGAYGEPALNIMNQNEKRSLSNSYLQKSLIEPGQEHDTKLSIEVSPEESNEKPNVNQAPINPFHPLMNSSDFIKYLHNARYDPITEYFDLSANRLPSSSYEMNMNFNRMAMLNNSSPFNMDYFNRYNSIQALHTPMSLVTPKHAPSSGELSSSGRHSYSSGQLKSKYEKHMMNNEDFTNQLSKFNNVYEPSHAAVKTENDVSVQKKHDPKTVWRKRFDFSATN